MRALCTLRVDDGPYGGAGFGVGKTGADQVEGVQEYGWPDAVACAVA